MQRLSRDGVALAYEEAGSGAPPIIFVHGWSCDHTHFTPQYEYFRNGHRVVGVDLRGHGESDKPEQSYTMGSFADDLAWLCGELGIYKPVVVGHSMGGCIALELAARRPDLPAAIVAIDSPVVPPPYIGQAFGQLLEGLRSPAFRDAARGFSANALFLATDDPEVKRRVLEGGMSYLPQSVLVSAFENIALWDGAAAASACTVPTLLISGAMPLADVERLRQLCPQLVTGQTVGAGHFAQLIVPEQVNAMLERFLTTSLAQPEATAESGSTVAV